MIISSFNAGLGNQLFQYAFGRVLSLYHNVPFKTETYWFQHEQNTSHRRYGLTHFTIQAPEASWQELDEYIHADTWLHRMVHPYYKRIRIYEKAARYDPNVWKFPKHTYVSGYWQAWRYYQDYHNVLTNELQIKTPPSEQAKPLIDQLTGPASVAIHIRRGDYLTNPSFNTLPPDYYTRAITYLQERFENLTWYVFSDDLAWVSQHITLPRQTRLIEGLSDIDDFRLMNLTRHTVIANSTFSWWAAWLKTGSEHVTVAPKIPFTNASLWPADEYFPPYFVRL